MGKHIDIYSSGICYCSVCAPVGMPIGEVEELTNSQSPAGISPPWSLDGAEIFKTGEPNPHPCEEIDDCQHWLMSC